MGDTQRAPIVGRDTGQGADAAAVQLAAMIGSVAPVHPESVPIPNQHACVTHGMAFGGEDRDVIVEGERSREAAERGVAGAHESETIDARSVASWTEEVSRRLPARRVGAIHGRMRAEAREKAMRQFAAGELDVLVTTTVVEVGIDVPEATMIVIEHAERFGLSQLHPLRGRVGRGSRASSCFLMVGDAQGEEAAARLAIMERTTDGFRLAEEDLRIRGPGDFAGVRQSGIPDLVFADLVRDAGVLRVAKEVAEELHRRDPDLSAHGHEGIRRFLERRSGAVDPAG